MSMRNYSNNQGAIRAPAGGLRSEKSYSPFQPRANEIGNNIYDRAVRAKSKLQ